MSYHDNLRIAFITALLVLSTAGTVGARSERDLYLEVFLNDQPTNLIARFSEGVDGRLRADATELRNTGILPEGRDRSGEVHLDRLQGVSYVLDEAAQTLHVTAAEEALATRIIDAQPNLDDDLEAPVEAGRGLVLNYNLSSEARSDGLGGFVAGDFDARVFSSLGMLSHGFTLSSQHHDRSSAYQRLDTYWRSSFPSRAVQLQIGDVITRGPTWSRPVRLGGVLVERNFALQPDLVTIPLPGYEGTAALPSTVEVYADSIRRFSADVPAGPFALTDLPFATGSGKAEVVLRDTTGRERRIDLPFYVTADLLRKGIAHWAFAFGKPRVGSGTASDLYFDQAFGAATLQFGLSDGLTLGAHAEAGEDLKMGGISASFRLGTRGVSTVSFARSQWDEAAGSRGEISAEMSFGRMRVAARAYRTWGDFADVARATIEPAGIAPGRDPFAYSLNQLSVSTPLFSEGGAAASLFYAEMRQRDEPAVRSLGATWSQPIFEQSTLNLTAVAQDGVTSDVTLGVGLHVPLGARRHAMATQERRGDNWRTTASLSNDAEHRSRGWDWRAQAVRDTHSRLRGSVTRRSGLGRIEVGASLAENDQSVGLRAEGALVLAGGGIFASARVHDAFAIVDVGAPGVEVKLENRSIGTTGQSGRLMVPGLRSYDANSLKINPLSLPLDADIPSTSIVVRPAHRSGVTVDFGIDVAATSATVELLSPEGEPLPVGLSAVLNGKSSLLLGYDGLIYARGLAERNVLVVQHVNGSTCEASFAYRDEPGTITRIEGVVCQ